MGDFVNGKVENGERLFYQGKWRSNEGTFLYLYDQAHHSEMIGVQNVIGRMIMWEEHPR